MEEASGLSERALDAIAKHFYYLWNSILLNPQSQEVRKDIETVAPIFKDLHSHLVKNVPVALDNKLTNKLLVTLHEWLQVVICDKYMIIMVARNVTHPFVTRIETGQESLHCSDIFNRKSGINNEFLGDYLAMTAQIPNLEALHMVYYYSENRDLVSFTSQLEEFSGGRIDDNILMKIAKTCKNLKYLDVCYSKDITVNSVDVILNEMVQLEWLSIANTGITSNGTIRLLRGFIQKGAYLKLKYLQISYTSECLELLKMLPSLILSLQSHWIMPTRFANYYFPMSDLFVLHNLRCLSIIASLREINDLLREIGSQLVYLDLRITSFDSEYFKNDCNFLNMLLIGHYCKKLKCLHISDSFGNYPNVKYFSSLPLRGFLSVTCLKINLSEFVRSNTTCIENIVYTLASQCINVKKVTILVDPYVQTRLKLVRNLVQKNCLKITEEVYFKFRDNGRLAIFEDEKIKDEEVLELLVKHCSKLHTVGGFPTVLTYH